MGVRGSAQDYEDGPTRVFVGLPGVLAALEAQEGGHEHGRINASVVALRETFRKQLEETSRQLAAFELVVKDVAEEFGEDPMLPERRHVIEQNRDQLNELHAYAQTLCGPFALPEPEEDDLSLVRLIVEQELEEPHHGTRHVRAGSPAGKDGL